MSLFEKEIAAIVNLALLEDRVSEDVTGQACIERDRRAQAEIYAKEALIYCGSPVIDPVLHLSGATIAYEVIAHEGEPYAVGDTLVKLAGNALDLLRVERVLLNFMQRLSGIATTTRSFAMEASPLKVYDTRKTTPGWRALEKYAVVKGGGTNHRMNLSDLILVKNNHIDANEGDIRLTLMRVFERKDAAMRVEVEVRNAEELACALEFPVDIIMLDNMRGEALMEAVKIIRMQPKSILIEASGNIDLQSLAEMKQAGVDAVSTSKITAGAFPVDIAMAISYQ
ncbi:MAG: carboxylating nicotinate-nucleotide diphosphorylase [Bdellovibrionales bacterium]|nr:carboxylating nicotinate-nucleotide diphosphorylase [Bdellovibrionales bacterium]